MREKNVYSFPYDERDANLRQHTIQTLSLVVTIRPPSSNDPVRPQTLAMRCVIVQCTAPARDKKPGTDSS